MDAGGHEDAALEVGGDAGPAFERVRHHAARLLARGANVVEDPERRDEPQLELGVMVCLRLRKRATKVVALELELVKKIRGDGVPRAGLGQLDEVLEVTAACGGGFAVALEPLDGVLADGLEHSEAHRIGSVLSVEQVVVNQSLDLVDVGLADGRRRLEGEATCEDG